MKQNTFLGRFFLHLVAATLKGLDHLIRMNVECRTRDLRFRFLKSEKQKDVQKLLETIHKGRLLKGVGSWVHQKEIYALHKVI